MATLFSASELLDVAIGIERNGLVFYESLAKTSPEKKVCRACSYLADTEREHLKVFEDMRRAMGDNPQDTFDEEYSLYLKSLIDSVGFTEDKVRTMLAKGAESIEALEFALWAEKDSILFYSEMRHLVPERERTSVERVIREEKGHFRHIVELKTSLAAGQRAKR